MEERNGSVNKLQKLLLSIKSSDVAEHRVELLAKLAGLGFPEEKSELASVVDCLICMLNKAILQVAAKCVGSDLSGCLVPFLSLVTKARAWCGKHLKMTLMSTGESQEEEHSAEFFQLLLEFLNLSTACMMTLTKCPVSTENSSMTMVEKFILELLNLTKDIVSDAKRINSLGCEVQKVAQTIIDAVLNLCKEYATGLNWDISDTRPQCDGSVVDNNKFEVENHVINIMKCTVENLCQLGVLAGNDGGSLVNILNVSWKGVVALLQSGKILTEVIVIQEIITTLISLASGPMRCAAEAWSSSLTETISVSEARRTFLPVKFYLIHAVKIATLYPSQAYLVHREMALCVLLISTFKVFLSRENLLNSASEVFSELLEKTSLDLLSSLLNSSEVKQDSKFELLDWVFPDECRLNSFHGDSNSCYRLTLLADIFSVNSHVVHEARLLSLGRLVLFHNFLRFSNGLDEAVKNKITTKLGWLLDVLVGEEIYSLVLDLQIPVTYGSGKTNELLWEPFFSALSQALKTFMIVVFSSFAWVELEAFLVNNLFHPHFLCCEIVLDLWCFMMRHAEIDVVNVVIDKLCSTMMLLESPESVHIPGSPLRKMARIICMLLTSGAPSMAVHVYSSVVSDGRCKLSTAMYVALLLEGFPLNSLSDNLRSVAKQNIITDYFGFIGSFDEKLTNASSSSTFWFPVLALSASLHSRQVSMSDVDMKTLMLLVAIIRNIRNPVVKLLKEQYHKLLSEALEIISNMKHLYESDAIEEAILELHKVFVAERVAADAQLSQCKPYLALFMGGLGDMAMSENDDCPRSTAVWELYHMLFREQHWALVHHAIAAFGYFAARTSCNQLWKFMPPDAALSYDLISGKEANEERFMLELKAFLEKETALLAVTPSLEQVELLMKEGAVLKEMVEKITTHYTESVEYKNPETDIDSQSNKRRKLPDGISKGVELLQSGLKVIGNGLSQWPQNHPESLELHDKLLTQFSHLEDVISRLMNLAGNG
ncbi:hypothetical protein Tsubulata_035029 [Turnera subulata]|uniref:Uncharacterized protein n=1 Tax=Turnera subulata TaxID=218843 RepID=A0A9Q0F862_9ROSI|nr:hypothetical protein Tsubulata_035029 [Turnera subulata]